MSLPLPSTVNNPIYPVKPADATYLGLPTMFVYELAMKTAPVKDICTAYGVTKAQFEDMVVDPIFKFAYEAACEQLQKEGVSFKMKSQMLCEDALRFAHAMMNDKDVPASVRADLAKSLVRWAGYEQKTGGDAANLANNMQVVINLG